MKETKTNITTALTAPELNALERIANSKGWSKAKALRSLIPLKKAKRP